MLGPPRGGELWHGASWELGFASRELPGCRCSGRWEAFRELLNWTLAHEAPESGAGEAAAARLCARHAAPLVRASLGGDLLAAARTPGRAETHACPAGLVAALGLCARVHARPEEGTPRPGGADAAWRGGPGPLHWVRAFQTWPEGLPEDCAQRRSCLAYLEGLLAASVLPQCIHCLEPSLWPVDAQEVADNAMSWLQWRHEAAPRAPFPPWRGPSPASLAKRRYSAAAAGVFTVGTHGELGGAAGASRLLLEVARSWTAPALDALLTAPCGGAEGGPGCEPGRPAARHLAHIFGPLLRPYDIGARGPLGVHVRVHREDFSGPRAALRFFVYDLPGAAHAEPLAALHGRVREATLKPSNCDFGLSPCTELHSGGGAFSGYRPYAAEATFLAKLLVSPPGVVVDDPEKASFFVVPFLSSTWCFLAAPKCWVRCGGLRPLNALLPLLVHYNASTAPRHLFLASDSTGDLPVDLQLQPLVLSYGPSACDGGSGPIIMPPPVTDELPALGAQEFASKDLFVFAADGIGGRPFRREASEELQRWQRRFPQLFAVARRDGGPAAAPPSPSEWAQQLRRAVFCPVLPGDNTFRMRLFHAVLGGCIPVVVLFPGGSWYRSHGPAVERSLPFARRGVDWRGLALELPHDPAAEDFGAWARRLVPAMASLGAEEVRRRQLLLAEAAPRLRFDLAGARPDAFTLLLDELAERAAAARAPAAARALECFDPRERFGTERGLSGFPAVAREEREVLGVAACCAAPAREPAAGNASRARGGGCDLRARGRCVRLRLRGAEPQAAHLRRHLRALLARERFEALLPEDQLCAR